MAGETVFHNVRKGDLKTGAVYAQWADPDRIAPMHPRKIAAIMGAPFEVPDETVVSIVATRDGEVAGKIDFVPGRMVVDGKESVIGWGSTLFVPPKHRGSMAGLYLVMKSQSIGVDVGAHGPSQMALPIYQKLKWLDLPLRRVIHLRKGRCVVERFVGTGVKGLAGRMGVGIALLGLHGAMGVWRGVACRGLSVREVRSMPAEHDAVIRAGGVGARRVRCFRSAGWINWQISSPLSDEARTTRRLYLVERGGVGGKTVGYFITKARFFESATRYNLKNLYLGSVMDWMEFEAGGLSLMQISLLACRELGREGVDAVELCTDDAATLAKLRRPLWMPAGEMHMVVKAMNGSPLKGPGMDQQSNWDLRPADADNLLA